MYRPPNWENPYKDWFGKGEMTLKMDYETNQHYSYEAGADAALDALIKEGEHFVWDKEVLTVKVPTLFRRNFRGTFVFIPDEEKEE